MSKIRIGIAGTGKIVPESAEALRESGYELVSIWGPHPEKAVPLAERFGIPHLCSSYDELLASGIDFVYIALVNSVHFEYAGKALASGVNVLLEKPFCSTLRQAEELAEIARSRGLYLFETISNIYLPAWAMLKERLPEIGEVKMFQADFSQYSSRYDAYLSGDVSASFNPSCEGGALRDINIYNLHLAVDLFGRPDEVIFRANLGYNGIDTSGTVLLRYPNLIAVCTAAKDSGNPSGITVQGDKGYIRIAGMPNILPSLEVCIRGRQAEFFTPNIYASRLRSQFETIRDTYLCGEYDGMLARLSHTLLVMEALEKCFPACI
ncbi:MAG: Gfo/Idh/MocA family oxidoreductase [Bacteroidales bacterium]|nr:Gfo/Idh/MocA family oxidoreductase [Bacteroidales bacterium]